ncbi:MAG: hypothetical protein AAFU72_09525, partial [Pseudomonadota bacterium]
VLQSDAALFGSDFVGGALPYSLDEPIEEDTPTTDASGNDRPRRPSPPSGGTIGLGTGGLY